MYGTVKEIIEQLSRRNQDEVIGALVWDTDEIKESLAYARNEKIDDDLASAILKRVITTHDFGNGVSRETVLCTADNIRHGYDDD